MSSDQGQIPNKPVQIPEATAPAPPSRPGKGDILRASDSALFRPVVDDSCRRSFVLPASFTLDALQKERLDKKSEPQGGGGTTADKPRAMSPMSTLLIRTDY